MRLRSSAGLQACLFALLAPTLASAQNTPPPLTNIKVLPKDMTRDQVTALMRQFVVDLGVGGTGGAGCAHCHFEQTAPLLSVEEQLAAQAAAAAAPPAGAAGRGRGRGPVRPQMDFPADGKRQKETARVMIAMTRDVNARLATSLKKPVGEVTKVQCGTCHRGVTIPAQLSDLLRQTMLGKGEGAAVVQYRELRQQYLNTGAYDFRETTLLDLGRESLATRKPDDALAWLQLNVEFYPRSAPSFIELAKAHLARRDRDSAVADLTKALTIDPSNADASRELARLKK